MIKTAIIILLFIATAFAVSPTFVSFNTGQVSPELEARPDFQKYTSSCRLIENMFAIVHGSAVRRSGTRYVAETKSSNEARLIPFLVSTNDSYILEFTDGFLRFYRDSELD